MYNPHKTILATERGINIYFLDGEYSKRTYKAYDKFPLSKLQIQGSVKYQKLENQRFTYNQNKLYQLLVYGLNTIDDVELSKLTPEDKYEIKTQYLKAQKIINRLKQEIANSSINSFLSKLFPKSQTIKDLCLINETDDSYWCKLTFKDLGLSKITIAEHLVKHQLLPKNFFQIK